MCVSTLNVIKLTTRISTVTDLSSSTFPGLRFHTPHHHSDASAMCGFATKEMLVSMDLPVQQGKTKSLRVFQFRKEDLNAKHFSACSGLCADGTLAKSRNVAIKSFQKL